MKSTRNNPEIKQSDLRNLNNLDKNQLLRLVLQLHRKNQLLKEEVANYKVQEARRELSFFKRMLCYPDFPIFGFMDASDDEKDIQKQTQIKRSQSMPNLPIQEIKEEHSNVKPKR